MTARLMIVDDDRRLLESMCEWLNTQGFECIPASGVAAAIQLQTKQPADLVLCDMRLEDGDGFDFLTWCRKNCPSVPFLMISGYASPDTAVEAVAAGAFDMLSKPVIDQELLHCLNRALKQAEIAEENNRLRQELDRRFGIENILSHDYRMLKIFDMIESVADVRATVLITGENGTGKSMIARAVHRRSTRRNKPFVEVACGALPDNLLESELFGHVAGSFTGATQNKIGRFKQADGGTLFLDEIGTATQAMQVKLLRVLQEFQFEPVGGIETISVDTRPILATNENLEKAVREGTFRQDLYYRINVIHIELPALRERSSDIPLLVEHFLQQFTQETGRKVEGFSTEAMNQMQQYAWPGNIRELENVVQRSVLLTKTPYVEASDLPPQFRSSGYSTSAAMASVSPTSAQRGQSLRDALDAPERQIILDVLRSNGWNRNETADQLGINRTTLYKKMKRLGLDDPRLLESIGR